jgi:hypothetical protein
MSLSRLSADVAAAVSLRARILWLGHAHPMSGHRGVTGTFERLKSQYWWPTLYRDVEQFVLSCDSCQRVTASQQKAAGPLRPLPVAKRPWAWVTMDFVTDLPPDTNGHDAILVVVDRFSKMAHFRPCTTAITAQCTAELFVETVISRWYAPEICVTDGGPQFTAAFTHALFEMWGIDLRHSTAYHPQTDGQSERKTLRTICGTTLPTILPPGLGSYPWPNLRSTRLVWSRSMARLFGCSMALILALP